MQVNPNNSTRENMVWVNSLFIIDEQQCPGSKSSVCTFYTTYIGLLAGLKRWTSVASLSMNANDPAFRPPPRGSRSGQLSVRGSFSVRSEPFNMTVHLSAPLWTPCHYCWWWYGSRLLWLWRKYAQKICLLHQVAYFGKLCGIRCLHLTSPHYANKCNWI